MLARYHRYTKRSESGCIEWLGSKLPKGYGMICVGNQKRMYAHRWAYQHFKGPISEGILVCHSCDNPSCVNPEHLFLGTHSDNNYDSVRKGRHTQGFKTSTTAGEANTKSKLTANDVLAIRASKASQKELAAKYNVSTVMISYILLRRNWTHI